MNAGYKNDESSQNYDFIELERTVDADLDLSSFRIVYINSSGNLAGEISFSEHLLLSTDYLILGAAISPQYSSAEGSYYLYNFGSAGLASTAGKLELYQDKHKIDEICWGKLECADNYAKFATKEDDNFSLVRCVKDCSERRFISEKHYPVLNLNSITEVALESSEEPTISCDGIIITEIYSNYINSVSEQFIELYNPSLAPIVLNSCFLRYKTTDYPLDGELKAGEYYIFQNPDLSLTKDPSSSNLVSIIDQEKQAITQINYPHGQKKGTSYALFDLGKDTHIWRQTYHITPSAANIYQEFKTCESGKVINPATGNCINQTTTTKTSTVCPAGKYLNPQTNRCKSISTVSSLTPCKEGYERNPETNRCRKKTTTTEPVPCKEGYERNPETNRCRKIRENVGETAEYAPIPTEETKQYHNPKIFIATAAIATAILAGAIYIICQYRQNIRKALKAFGNRFRKV